MKTFHTEQPLSVLLKNWFDLPGPGLRRVVWALLTIFFILLIYRHYRLINEQSAYYDASDKEKIHMEAFLNER